MISRFYRAAQKTNGGNSSRDNEFPLIADEQLFNYLLALERKRTERTGDPFILTLLDVTRLTERTSERQVSDICAAIRAGTRDTDAWGWYKSGAVI